MMKYFKLTELYRSSTADVRGINNQPDALTIGHLTYLVEFVLDPIREKWAAPILVSSGYRCPALNKAVGGVATSMHLQGLAADIYPKANDIKQRNERLDQLFDMITEQMPELPFDKCIFEENKKTGARWIHITFNPKNSTSETARRIVIPYMEQK